VQTHPPATPIAIETVLAESDWLERRAAYRARIEAWTRPHRERASLQRKHPVYDFLFEYYSFRPRQLETWHPGVGVALSGAAAREYLALPGYREVPEGVAANPAWIKPSRRDGIRWTLALLKITAKRAPFFGCFGLHEWAMVYRSPEVRHSAWPLRFEANRLAEIVESQAIRCSHFDAFRFFTEAARPLNRLQPDRTSAPRLEQRGCLHANMDLYKWAFKLAPFTPSELIADTFELAWAVRETDMRASPYDLRALGFAPIAIETPEGRMEYERLQREFSEQGQPLRRRLIDAYERLWASIGPGEPGESAPERGGL